MSAIPRQAPALLETRHAGETREEVSFIDCTCFGRTAEVVSEYCHKGDPLLVDGRLKQENWEDKGGGGKRSRLVVVDQVQLLGGRGGGQGAGERRATAASAGAKSAPAQGDSGDGGGAPAEDDVPF